VAAALLAACGGGSGGGDDPPTNGGGTTYTPTVTAKSNINAPITLQLLSAQGTINTPLTLTFSGSGAARLRDATGAALSGPVTASNGIVSLSLSSGAAPTVDAPVAFTVIVQGAGYLTTSAKVSISSASGQAADIQLVALTTDSSGNLTHTQPGVEGTVKVLGTVAGGQVATVMSLSSPDVEDSSGNTVGGAGLSIPAGTTLRTATGAAAANGPVTASVVSFSSSSPTALQAFPGGFAVTVGGSGPGTGTGVFTSGGFAAFNLTDAQGNAIKSFDSPITATIALSDTLINEDTGLPVAVGDTLPVYSYDETTARWTKENSGIVSRDAQGKLVLTFSSNHLSYWNMDWYSSAVCTGRINITGLNSAVNLSAFRNPATGYLYSGQATPDNPSFAIYNMPSGLPLRIEARLPTGELVGSVNVNDGCAGTIALNVVTPPTPRVVVPTAEACFSSTGAIIESTKRPLPAYAYLTRNESYTYTYSWLPWYNYSYTYTYTYESYLAYAYSSFTAGATTAQATLLAPTQPYNNYNVRIYTTRGDSRTLTGIATGANGATTTLPEVVFPMTCQTTTTPPATGGTGGTGGSGGGGTTGPVQG